MDALWTQSERVMATIRKRHGKWFVEIRKKLHEPIRKTFVLKEMAERYAREKEGEIESGLVVNYEAAANTTLGELLERYRKEITSKKKSPYSEDCKIKYLCTLDICSLSLIRVTPSKVAKLRDWLSQERAPGTVVKYLAYISNCWNIARKEWDFTLPPNPVSGVSKPIVRNRRERVLTKAEYQRLLEAASKSKHYMYGMVVFAYNTAARFGEIIKLKKADVDFKKRTATLRDTKNGEDRKIPLTEEAIEVLKDQIPNTSGHFFNVGTDDAFKHHWTKVKIAAEIDNFRFHDLRACAITNFMLPPFNFTIAKTAAISGHKSWDELKRYERIKAEHIVQEFQKLNK